MAVNLSAFVRQSDEQIGLKDGNIFYSITYKGEFAALKTEALKLSNGDLFEGNKFVDSWDLRRLPGDLGELRLSVVTKGSLTIDGAFDDESEPTLISDVWSCRSIRNDVSILGYCDGGDDNPQRALIEAWQKEPDGALARQHKYRDSDNKPVEIKHGPTLDVISKIERGIDSVMRFYPMVTRKRTYDTEPETVFENLSRIDEPPVPAHVKDVEEAEKDEPNEKKRKVRVSRGLKNFVGLCTWLKCQDDVEEQSDGKWVRVESWMGIETSKARYGWDEDLYGNDRWNMPHTRTGSGDYGTPTGDNS